MKCIVLWGSFFETQNKTKQGKMKMMNRTLFFTYLYLLIYILLSSGVILYNKVAFFLSLIGFLSYDFVQKHERFCFCFCQWVLSPKYFNFPFPITLTMIHMGFSGLVAFFLVRVFKVCQFIFTVDMFTTMCAFLCAYLITRIHICSSYLD